ncbi:putative E3 ubiquitin-protein ligase SMURF1 [Blattamonas nauphoetae]|uniref:E3 ubiquitin-protein ligase SMURF1 n=1 Tax=Blattamonas nauphoetae TaxID=2049346 RepID=A0ABQ9YB10_9EUKA|nr:putative E3 ubiquitin-protein ligase SMURF1 [Blattamonas nauphoetae]
MTTNRANPKVSKRFEVKVPDPYKFIRTLGQGRFGSVHEVSKTPTDEHYAMKILPFVSEADFKKNEHEIAKLKKNQHRNVVGFEEVIEGDMAHFVVLELCSHSLQDDLSENQKLGGKMDVVRVYRVMRDVLDGIAFLHSHGEIYADLKGSNVLIGQDGTAKLGDFGGVVGTGTMKTSYSAECGTMQYWAPEFFEQAIQPNAQIGSPAGDMWAFGQLLLEMLTSRSWIVGGSSVEIEKSVLGFDIAHVCASEGIVGEVQILLSLLLSKNPSQRISSADLVRSNRLQSLLGPETPLSRFIAEQYQASRQAELGAKARIEYLEKEQSHVNDENRKLKEVCLQRNVPTELSERDVLFTIHSNDMFTLEACKLRNEAQPRVVRYRHNPDSKLLAKLADERDDVLRAPAAAVVPYFRSGLIDNTYEAQMDVDPETNLARMNQVRSVRAWSQEDILKLLAQILKGLDILHKAEIVHRHMAPHCVYVPSDGPAQFSDLFDQTYCEYGETTDDEFYSDSVYRAPESFEEDLEYDGRSDIWSIGVMMYELVSGHFPFPQKSAMSVRSEIGRKRINPVPETVPEPLRDIIGKMLNFDANERPNAETLLNEPCFSVFLQQLEPATAATTARVQAPSVRLLKTSFSESFEIRRQNFMDALSAIQPVKMFGSCKVLFPSDANIAKSMVAMYKLSHAEILEPFFVMLEGTNAIDVNGVKRWFFTKLVEKLTDPKDLGLFVPDWAGNQKLTIPSDPKFLAPEYHQFYKFAGLVLAKVMLERLNMPFRFNKFIWKQLQGFAMEPSDLQYLRPDLYATLEEMRGYSSEELTDNAQAWVFTSPDGQILSLNPGGENTRVTFEDLPEFVDLSCLAILNYYSPILTAMRSELHTLVPEHVLRLLSPEELELIVCGTDEIDVDDWKRHTKYSEELSSHPQVIAAFWEMVKKADNNMRREILRLGTGLTNAPPGGFKDLKASPTARSGGFNLNSLGVARLVMPEGHMTFNRLDIPLLEDTDMMRTAFLMAIRNAAPPTD